MEVHVSQQGLSELAAPLEYETTPHVDVLVVGSVAVSRAGLRVGKGLGRADLQWAAMRSCGAATADTIVVTTVHDEQVVEIAEELTKPNDLVVDYIITPTEVISCGRREKPGPVDWKLLPGDRVKKLVALVALQDMDKAAGRATEVGAERVREPRAPGQQGQ